MRSVYLLLSACALLSGGCSCMIAQSGKDLEPIVRRDQVHREFGEPQATGVTDGQTFDDYKTNLKISEPQRAADLSMSDAMTFGFEEFIAFPQELYLLCSRKMFGQTIRFTYNAEGNVTGVYLDDERIDFSPDRKWGQSIAPTAKVTPVQQSPASNR
ncbi:MAG TPA: hypothetical protein VGP68_23045 [Gemmataceae bacterium]|nr:hypothetical protein [Gemmataceae bacterium]